MTQDPRAMAIKRYTPDWVGGEAFGGPACVEAIDGEYVVYDDHMESLADERRRVWEEAAVIAENEKVDYEDTKEPTDKAYNQACDDVINAIRAKAHADQEENHEG